ncbi:hypothetical protein MIR68_000600 [Amoeboaphelidium protococcarum]|nr:hypothetical protein MIR68_000600 [Amoeboaphelidium protococcarum]
MVGRCIKKRLPPRVLVWRRSLVLQMLKGLCDEFQAWCQAKLVKIKVMVSSCFVRLSFWALQNR